MWVKKKKILWKYVLYYLNNENYCLNTPTKHSLSMGYIYM